MLVIKIRPSNHEHDIFNTKIHLHPSSLFHCWNCEAALFSKFQKNRSWNFRYSLLNVYHVNCEIEFLRKQKLAYIQTFFLSSRGATRSLFSELAKSGTVSQETKQLCQLYSTNSTSRICKIRETFTFEKFSKKGLQINGLANIIYCNRLRQGGHWFLKHRFWENLGELKRGSHLCPINSSPIHRRFVAIKSSSGNT